MKKAFDSKKNKGTETIITNGGIGNINNGNAFDKTGTITGDDYYGIGGGGTGIRVIASPIRI